jgi:hypothetical protein
MAGALHYVDVRGDVMTKTFKVERKGKQTWVVIRQMPHDPQYAVGSRIPGLGKVVEVR